MPIERGLSFHDATMRTTRRLCVLTALFLAAGITPAFAAGSVTCSFDAGTATATIDVSAASTFTIDRGGDEIRLDGTACDAATVTNTDTITVTAATGSELVIDLAGGPLAPGATDEGDGSSEIEIAADFLDGASGGAPGTVRVEGSGGPDAIFAYLVLAIPSHVINLNADEVPPDYDVTFPRAAGAILRGNDGADILRGLDPAGAGRELLTPIDIGGGGGDDTLSVAAPGGSLDGGPGTDLLDESAVGRMIIFLDDHMEVGSSPFGPTLTGLENARGGPEDDYIMGPNADVENTLEGGGGFDTLVGAQGNDVLIGGDGYDTFYGMAGDDTMIGGLDGQPDEFSFLESPGGVTVDIAAGTATGEGSDTFQASFAVITGSRFDDHLLGDENPNGFVGIAGADTIEAGGGNDLIDGGDGADLIMPGAGNDSVNGGNDGSDDALGFEDAGAGVTVNLMAGTAVGDGTDTINGTFRTVTGSAFDDHLIGDDGPNTLRGALGADRLDGRGGADVLGGGLGADTLHGGDGRDVLAGRKGNDLLAGGRGRDLVDYQLASQGIVLDLDTGVARGEGIDHLIDIENVDGTPFADRIVGSRAANDLDGWQGRDHLAGGAGPDDLDGGAGRDACDGGPGTDHARHCEVVTGVP